MLIKEPKWLLKKVVQSFHDKQLIEHGGLHGMRDESLLDSAMNKPLQMWSYQEPKPDVPSLAAAYAYRLATNHPYLDGNKRTAAIACEVFLLLNGYEFIVDETAKYPHYLGLEAGDHTQETFTEWVKNNVKEIN